LDAAEKPPLALRRYRAPQRVDPAFAADKTGPYEAR
jgi:hypothetical protein